MKIRVLLIEDNPADADLIEEILGDIEGSPFEIIHAEMLADGLDCLAKGGVDVVLLDLSLPDSHGLETFTSVRAKTSKVPIIVLSGLNDETVALAAVAEGAQDYLVKGRVDSEVLSRAMRYAMERHRMLMELDGYAHTVSHDLKGPLAAMKLANSSIQKLLSMTLTDQVRHDIQISAGILDGNIDKASRLVDDLLLLAEAGQRPKEVTDVDVGATVARVLSEKQEVIEARGTTVFVPEDLGVVRASETHIYQVFSNLIGNAINHGDASEPRIAIDYEKSPDGRHTYTVCDNGPGVPPELMDSVFIPFFKGASAGTGIGLSIVERIARTYEGEAHAYNDCGACFVVSLKDMPD